MLNMSHVKVTAVELALPFPHVDKEVGRSVRAPVYWLMCGSFRLGEMGGAMPGLGLTNHDSCHDASPSIQ